MADPSDTNAPSPMTGLLRIAVGFACGMVVWTALFTLFVAVYPASWGYGLLQAVLVVAAWCLSSAAGALVCVLVAQERGGAVGALRGATLGFVLAGGGLLYSVTGHRPAGSDAWPTDLLVWMIALVLAVVSGLAGGWIMGAALSRRA
jgi:hypothetical protein